MRMEKTLYLYLLLAVAILTGCDGGRMPEELGAISIMTDTNPDSALACLDSLTARKAGWSKAAQMRYDLLRAKAQNKAYIPFTSDSAATAFTHYYDSHGTPNDRLQAHYLLGCVYRDLGESPRAVNCFSDAIAAADTTAEDCDYRTMSTAYSQMAIVYHKQLLLSYELEASKLASHYALLAKDTFLAIYNIDLAAINYILTNKKDTAETILWEVQKKYRQHGYLQYAYQTNVSILHLLVEQPDRLAEAKQLIDEYETKSEYFDQNHELPPIRRQYYYYKGKYYEGIGKLDSAEYCYRKVQCPNMSPVQKDPMYRGLLSVFKKRHQADSIAKYAQLYCEANDSSIALKDQELTAQMAASYNYIHYQKESQEKEAKVFQLKMLLLLITAVFLVLAFCGYIVWKHYKQTQHLKQEEKNRLHQKEIDHLKAEYASVSVQYAEKLQVLRGLVEMERAIAEANTQYKAEVDKLLGEIETLKNQLKNLERRKDIANWRRISIPFSETGIIKRIKLFITNPQKSLSDSDLELLVQTVNEYYPDLILDLTKTVGSNSLGTYVCILTALNVSPGDITRLVGIKSSQVSNIRQNINRLLFNEKTARTLPANLMNKYHLPEI